LTIDGPERIEPDVVRELYDQYQKELRAFLLGRLRNADLAEEILQETLATALKSAHQSNEDTRKGWLFTVAANLANRHARREQSELRVVQGLAWIVPPSSDHTSEIVQKETIERAKRVLAELPDDQQQVVSLRIYDGMKFRESAEHLGIPLGTVQTRMHAAITKLRSEMGRD